MNEKPKQFVLQLGAIVSLYVLIISFLLLTYSIIDLMIPDAVEGYWEMQSVGNTARAAIAFLLVSTPTYLILTRLINQHRRRDTSEVYAPIMRWLIYLSLFVGSTVLLGYVVGLIMQFLNGELTLRFLLKTAATGVIISAAMTYYIQDAKSYWNERPDTLKMLGRVVLGAVTAIILLSFTVIDSPAAVREIRLDQEQVQELRDIEWRIEEVINNTGTLPESIAVLYPDGVAPEAPDGREPYTFTFTDSSYELCATFHEANPQVAASDQPFPVRTRHTANDTYTITGYNDWQYEPGRYCFERAVSFANGAEEEVTSE